MSQVLLIEASPRGPESASRQLAGKVIETLKKNHTDVRVTHRDLTAQPIPHIDGVALAGFFAPAEQHTPEMKKAVDLSNTLVNELMEADIIVISTPMWNFSVPSVLKAWVDNIVRAGLTFAYTDTGIKGLVPSSKKIIIALSSGGVYSQAPMKSMDFVEPYFRAAFGFLGVQDVTVLRAEGTNDPKHSEHAMSKAFEQVEALVK